MSDDDDESALKDNIKSKGQNAYYYAHGNTPTGPVWDGKEEPKLLSREASIDASVKTIKYEKIEYAWADGDKKVSIYIEFDQMDNIDDDSITLDTSKNTFDFKFSITSGGKSYRLIVDNLHEEIESAIYKKKADKFLILLKKVNEISWSNLKKKS